MDDLNSNNNNILQNLTYAFSQCLKLKRLHIAYSDHIFLFAFLKSKNQSVNHISLISDRSRYSFNPTKEIQLSLLCKEFTLFILDRIERHNHLKYIELDYDWMNEYCQIYLNSNQREIMNIELLKIFGKN